MRRKTCNSQIISLQILLWVSGSEDRRRPFPKQYGVLQGNLKPSQWRSGYSTFQLERFAVRHCTKKDETTYHNTDGVDGLRIQKVEVDGSRDIVALQKPWIFLNSTWRSGLYVQRDPRKLSLGRFVRQWKCVNSWRPSSPRTSICWILKDKWVPRGSKWRSCKRAVYLVSWFIRHWFWMQNKIDPSPPKCDWLLNSGRNWSPG